LPGGSDGGDDDDAGFDYYDEGADADEAADAGDEEDEDGDVDVLPDFANEKARERHAEIKVHKSKLDTASSDLVETKTRYFFLQRRA
jgi:hypothetical protein